MGVSVIMALIINLWLVFALGTGAQAESVRNVPYVASAHVEQHLDFYWPTERPDATVLFVHGGSLQENAERRDSPEYREVCDRFVAVGLGCATIDYRLAPSFQWPAMPLDIAAAVVKVRELIEARGGDPARLFLFGHSSGCHLAAILGANGEYLEAVGLSTPDLAGVVAMGCVLDNRDAAVRGLTAAQIRGSFSQSRSDVARFGTPENWIAANPSYHIGPHTPPTLVVVAEEERFAPAILEQGARFVRRLRGWKVAADVVIVPGRHRSSIATVGAPGDPTLAAVLAFIEANSSAGSR